MAAAVRAVTAAVTVVVVHGAGPQTAGRGHELDGALPELAADVAACARSLTTNLAGVRTPGSTEAGT